MKIKGGLFGDSFYRVGKNTYVVMFIQSVAGFEEDILSEFEKHFEYVEHYLYYSFSEYDIVALIYLSGGDTYEDIKTFSHPKIKEFQQVVCFSQKHNALELIPDDALTLTLMKFRESEITKKGVFAEKSIGYILKEFFKRYSKYNVKHFLLSTLGWPELVLIQSGKTLSPLLTSIEKINTLGGPVDSFIQSHTFPCIKYEGNLLKKSLKKYENTPLQKGSDLVTDWQIAVSCVPSYIGELKNGILNTFGDEEDIAPVEVLATFGRRDLIIKPRLTQVEKNNQLSRKILTYNDLMSFLLELRQTYKHKILATHTIIEAPLNVDDLTITESHEKDIDSRRIMLDEKFEELSKKVQEFRDWEHEQENLTLSQACQLEQMVFRLRAISVTPGLEAIEKDLVAFVQSAVRKAHSQVNHIPVNAIDKTNREKYIELEDMENVFFFGLEQRMAGARLGLGNPVQAYSNIQGLGIQRILKASKAIPMGLLRGINKRIAEKWWGFTVFGYQNDTFTLPSGVINLPYQDLFHPEDWWKLGHESGHAFGMIVDLLDVPVLLEASQNVDNDVVRDLLGVDAIPLMDELVVSVFEYLYCFRGNFELYLKTTWSFFEHLLEGAPSKMKLKEYLLRSVFVYFFHLQTKQVSILGEKIEYAIKRGKLKRTLFNDNMEQALIERAFREAGSIENTILQEIVSPIENTLRTLHYLPCEEDINDLASLFSMHESLMWHLHDLFKQYLADKNSHIILSDLETQLTLISKQLKRGRIYLDFQSDLDVYLIPLALQYQQLKSGEKVSYQSQVAAILSLWHQARNWDVI